MIGIGVLETILETLHILSSKKNKVGQYKIHHKIVRLTKDMQRNPQVV